MGEQLESARLRALAQARRQLRHNDSPLEERRKHAEEVIAFYKKKLLAVAQAGQEAEARVLVEKLVELRARLTVIELEKLQDEEVILSPKKTAEIVKCYDDDCFALALATDRLLGIEHTL